MNFRKSCHGDPCEMELVCVDCLYLRTVVTIFGPKPFEEMGRDDRVRACYQHCALKFVMSQRMTNQSLRERFHLEESKASIPS
jgi:ATP-dependent DNA helicase RecG